MKTLKLFFLIIAGIWTYSSSISAQSAVQDFTFQGKPIGPECINQWDRPMRSIKLETDKCQTKQHDYDPQKLKDGLIGYSSPDGTYIYYKVLGKIHFQGFEKPFYYLIYTEFSGGGSGQFTSLDVFRLADGTLRKIENLDGGDRCNGGLDNVIFKDGTLTYVSNVTPLELYETYSGQSNPSVDLYDCALCCVGKIKYTGSSITSFEFNKDAVDNLGGDPGSPQVCYNGLIKETLQSGKTTLTPDELKAFIQKVKEKCLTK